MTASPTCPVETVPPNPSCAPRPVVGAIVIATDANGREVARAVSKGDGFYSMTLAPGTYALVPEATSQMMRAPQAESVTVTDSTGAVVNFAFDTGIR